MKLNTYRKAESIQSKIRRLQTIEEGIKEVGVQLVYGDSTLAVNLDLDPDVAEKITSSVLAIIQKELRDLNNEFLML